MSAAQKSRILGHLETAKREGAQLVLGNDQPSPDAKGYFVKPIIFKDTNRDMTPVREEVFGPFVVIQSFKDQKDAVEKANDTEYGLGAALFTENITRAHKVAASIQAGMVWVCTRRYNVVWHMLILNRLTAVKTPISLFRLADISRVVLEGNWVNMPCRPTLK